MLPPKKFGLIEGEVLRLENAVQTASAADEAGEARYRALALELGQYAPDLDALVAEAEEVQKTWRTWVTHVQDLIRREASTTQALGHQRALRDALDGKIAQSHAAEAEHREKLPGVERAEAAAREAELGERHLTTQLQEARAAVKESRCPTCGREYGAGGLEHAEGRLAEIQPRLNAAQAKARTAAHVAPQARNELHRIALGIRPGLPEEYERGVAEMTRLETEAEGLRTAAVPGAAAPLALPEALSTVQAYCQAGQQQATELRELSVRRRVLVGRAETERQALQRAGSDLAAAQAGLEAEWPKLGDGPTSSELAARWQGEKETVERVQAEVMGWTTWLPALQGRGG